MKRFSFELPSLATMSRFFSDNYTNDASVSLKGLIEHLRDRADALEELSYPEDDAMQDKPDDEIEEESLSIFADGDDIFLEAQVDSDQSGFWQGLRDNGIVEEIVDAPAGKDPEPAAPERPNGPGMYLHWDGRRTYRTRMPAPRVLQPVSKLCVAPTSGNRIIEGDNLQVMVSLRSQYRGAVDVAYLDPPYNTGKNDFRYSDRIASRRIGCMN